MHHNNQPPPGSPRGARNADQIGKYKPKTNPVHKGIRRQPSMQPRPHRKPQHINNPPTPQRPATGTPATQPSEPADQTGNRTTTSEPVHAGIGTRPTAQTVHANQVSIGKRSHLSASTDAETPLSVGRGLRDTRHGVPEVGQHMIRCPEPDLTMRPSDPNCMTCRPKPDCAVFRLITRNPAGRTHGVLRMRRDSNSRRVSPSHAFEACSFDRSDTHPSRSSLR